MTTPGSSDARAMARRLVDREMGGANGPIEPAVAMQRTFTRMSEVLVQSFGEDGYTALLARGLSRAQPSQPVLKDIRRVDGNRIRLDLGESTNGHGPDAIGVALEALFTAIVEILSDLIGADMVRNLLEYDEPARAPTHRPLR